MSAKLFAISFLFTAMLFPASAFLFSDGYKVVATGKVTCGDEPMPYVQVKLMDKDILTSDDEMATGKTNSQGSFSLSGEGRNPLGTGREPEPYIKVIYKYEGPTYGKMEVKKKVILGISLPREMKTSVRDYSESIDFGTIHIDDIHCLAYVRFYNALKDFKVRVEADTPYNMLHVLTDVDLDIPDYATTSDVELPKSLKMGNLTDQMAKHLLMHTVRQSYDGNDAHLRDDSSRFHYRQEHYCGKKTNAGMAFNEGFAEYWAGECNGTYGSSEDDYEIEGNVAKALRKLQKQCLRTPADMVAILRLFGKNQVHSFEDYNSFDILGVFGRSCHL